MELAQIGRLALDRLNRSAEYYDGLEQRLGFEVQDGRTFLVHAAGVSFTDEKTGKTRQELLAMAKAFCSFERTPPLQLVPEPTNPYDEHAVQVHIGIALDEVTGEWTMAQVGYLPKKRCPVCCISLSGKKSSSQLCPECETDIGIGSELEDLAVINAWVMHALEQGKVVKAGVDNITVPQHTTGNMGLDLWVRVDESDEGPDPTL